MSEIIPSSTPPWNAASTVAGDWTLHQIAPYLGRMKTSIARSLIEELTLPGDLVADPFCGSGVVALEASSLGRSVEVGDLNPYAVLLTKAKLFPPDNEEEALEKLHNAWKRSRHLISAQNLDEIPGWVRAFFHPETLRNILALRDACVESHDDFLLANLLGILHHQRPGFLSYPSSNLVPYLRNRKFPCEVFPEMYMERDVLSRMIAKIRRTLRRVPSLRQSSKNRVRRVDARLYPRVRGINAIITSPPYMNGLDYVRDNRLRIWFIKRGLPEGLELARRNRDEEFKNLIRAVILRFLDMLRPGGYLALVLGEVKRGALRNTAEFAMSLLAGDEFNNKLGIKRVYIDEVPADRRSRRECRGCTKEHVLIYERLA